MAYIDADVLKRNIRVNLMPNVDVDGTVTVENAERYFLNLIDEQPTADVVEVKHGEWVQDFDEDYYCSKCGHYPKADVRDYCPYCGAKMDGERRA